MALHFRFIDNTGPVALQFFHGAQQATLECGLAIREHIQDDMATAKHGNIYLVPGTRVPYTASAPDETPAIRTGILRTSIIVGLSMSADSIMATVGTTVYYGEILELKDTSRGGRPFMRRAALELMPQFPVIAARALRQRLR